MEIIKKIWHYFFPEKPKCIVCGKTDLEDPVIFQARDEQGIVKFEFHACFECAVEEEDNILDPDEDD